MGLTLVGRTRGKRFALSGEERIVHDQNLARYPLAAVSWSKEPLDPFFNANTIEDIAEAERLAALDDG